MLTPIEIKNKKFKGVFGYNKKDVDTFMFHVLENYETLYRQNQEINDKNGVLASNLASYKAIENQLEKSLILAQKAADDLRENAKKEAANIEENAKINARKLLEDAKDELRELENTIEKLSTQYESYKAQIKNVTFSQLELLENTTVKVPEKVHISLFDDENSKSDEVQTKEEAAITFDEEA